MHFLWVNSYRLIAGMIAKFIVPGEKNAPKGFILTAVLGAGSGRG